MADKVLGPNTKKLLAHFIALEAVPVGGGLAAGLRFLKDPTLRDEGVARAKTKMQEALDIIKATHDNPYGNDEEAIAAAILERLDKKNLSVSPLS